MTGVRSTEQVSRKYFESYKRSHSDAQSASKTQSSMVAISELEMECQQETSPPLLSGEYDELKEYLESGKFILTLSPSRY